MNTCSCMSTTPRSLVSVSPAVVGTYGMMSLLAVAAGRFAGLASPPSCIGPMGDCDALFHDPDGELNTVRVEPDEVIAGAQIGIHRCVLHAAGRVPAPDQGVRDGHSWRLAGTDVKLAAVQLRRRVQDQGTDPGTKVEHDAAGS